MLGDTLKISLNSNVELDILLSISSFLLHLGRYAVLSYFMVQTLNTVNNSPETQRDTNTAHMPTIERTYHGTWRQAIAHRHGFRDVTHNVFPFCSFCILCLPLLSKQTKYVILTYYATCLQNFVTPRL